MEVAGEGDLIDDLGGWEEDVIDLGASRCFSRLMQCNDSVFRYPIRCLSVCVLWLSILLELC